MRGSAIGQITASKSKSFPVGSYALGNVGWTELAIAKEKHLEKMEIPRNGKVTDTLGVLGTTISTSSSHLQLVLTGTRSDRSHRILRHP